MKKIGLFIISLLLVTGCGEKTPEVNNDDNPVEQAPVEQPTEKISIIDLDSNSRPYAVVINNYPAAVKAQTGLNKAYIIYEFPIEGGMTRSLALFKDVKDVKLGTVRSARHDYLDYVMENDAIFVHFGWSKEAEKQIYQLDIDNIDGNYADPKPFWRENPFNLAYEHRVYTNLSNVIDYNNNTKKYRNTTDVKPTLNYTVSSVDLSKYNDSKVANTVKLSYSSAFDVKFVYNNETSKYDRYVNGKLHKDYISGETFDAKNIIVTLIDWGYVTQYADAAGNNYLDLYNVGTGKGYYITDGYAREITWQKDTRSSQTVYKYLDGTEIDVNDGNTYIMFQSISKGANIN